jgi:excisionase family DNA binding protein
MPDSVEALRCVAIEELSGLLGVSVPTLRRWIRDGKLPARQPGGPGTRLLFPLAQISRLLEPPGPAAPKTVASSAATRARLSGRQPAWMATPTQSSDENERYSDVTKS